MPLSRLDSCLTPPVLPVELWELVLANLDSSSDVMHAMQTCRHLYFAGVRILYDHIKWQHPRRSAQNLAAWRSLEIRSRDHPSFWFAMPRSLTIAHHDFAPDDDMHASDQQPRREHATLTLDDPYAMSQRLMGHFVSSFRSLTSLHLFHSTIAETIYLAIFSLPQLRHLQIEHCTLPLVPPAYLGLFASLPIKTLVIKGVSSHNDAASIHRALPPLFFATAIGLGAITIDWTDEAAAFFARYSPFSRHHYSMPSGLRHLQVIMPCADSWPEDSDDMYLTHIAPIIQFLEATPTISRLSIVGRLPNFFLPISILPNLESFSGPTSLFFKLPTRDLSQLAFTDSLSLEHLPSLERLPAACPNLASLSFILDTFEDAVLNALSRFTLLPLTDISIIYRWPSKAVQHQLLDLLPRLHILRVYEDGTLPCFRQGTARRHHLDANGLTSDRGSQGASASSEEQLPAWIQTYPNLKEVQTYRTIAWKRCAGGDWAQVLVCKG